MQVFPFINGNNKDGIFRIQKFLRNLQALLHHGEPLAVAVSIRAVHIVVIILPVLCASIVWRIYVPTDFDTKGKALSGAKAAEKGLKRGLPR